MIVHKLLNALDKTFIAKKTEIDSQTGLPFSYECIRCTYIRSVLAGLVAGSGLGYIIDPVILFLKNFG